MINHVELKNFGPLSKISWKKLGPINLIIGANSCGKTFFLKALYSAMRTLEAYKRGDDQRTAAEILQEKLYWTFQTEKIGDLVSKGTDEHLSMKLAVNNSDFVYSFGKNTAKQITSLENHVPAREHNSIFLPAKEVLSIHNIILKSRDVDNVFGFDDTYLDLARALRQTTKGGKNYDSFAKSRKNLEDMLGGKVEYEESAGRWQFRKEKQRFHVGVMAEGIKKIAILDTLLGNRYLDPESIVFIDEPESSRFTPQPYPACWKSSRRWPTRASSSSWPANSYFVMKKLFLIAQEKNISITALVLENGQWCCSDMKDGMPDNPIISESIKLYEQEVGLSLR